MLHQNSKLFCLAFALLLCAGWLGESRNALADPPPWAPAYGYRKHHHHDHVVYKYYYYPAQQVYYSVDRGRYYYQDNGAWVYGVALPPRIQLGNHVSVDLGTPIPYTQHTTVIQTYPVLVR